MNNRYLSTPDKVANINFLQIASRNAKQAKMRLREKIQKISSTQNESIDEELSNDLKQMMAEQTDHVRSVYLEGSFARIFWDEQLKAAVAKNPKQVRWHPVIIKWCLNLKLMSSGTYNALRTSGFVKLPSERTLRDYTHYFQSKPGFQDDVNIMLKEEVHKASVPTERHYIGLLIDEMKVKEGLVYNKANIC